MALIPPPTAPAHRPPRRSPASLSGQASAEYAALLAVVAVALAGAGAAAGVADVPRRVVEVVRTGLCIVGGDVCRPVDAAADGLAPCITGEHASGAHLAVEIALLHLGERGVWTAAQRSDGSVLVTHVDDDSAGVVAGVGVAVPGIDVTLGVEGKADVSVAHGSAWELPSAAAAARLVAAVRRGEDPGLEPTWRFGDLGAELWGGAGLEIGASHPTSSVGLKGSILSALEASAGTSAGVRVGRGETTVYVHAHLDASSPFVSLPGPVSTTSASPDGGNGGPLLVGVTRDAHGLREISFERAQQGSRPGEIVDTVGRLDLRDPANRAAAEPLLSTRAPWPPTIAAALRAVLARTVQHGTIERATYAVTDRSQEVSLGLRAGLELGLSVGDIDVTRRLVSASAWTSGSTERHRFDCSA